MRAADLRYRVMLQARKNAPDELGQPSLEWADLCAVWADIQPMTARERMVAAANQSELTHLVSIRWQSQFRDPRYMATLRIKYDSRILNIQGSIDPSERHKTLELSCSEGLNDG